MTVATQTLSPLAYLTRERKSETKSEYFQGQVYQMAGASRNHNLIITNLIFVLKNQLRQRRGKNKCRVYPSDMRVKTESGLYTYPDIVVVCGPDQFEGNKQDVLLNSKVIIEVLPTSTKAYDHGKSSNIIARSPLWQSIFWLSRKHLRLNSMFGKMMEHGNKQSIAMFRIRFICQPSTVNYL